MPPKAKGAAVAASKIPSRDDRAAALMEKVNKKMKGRAQLKPASEYVLPFMTKRMPTGLLSLDIELGGGFPCGGVSQIVGAKNAGKTYLAWQVIRQQQFYKGDKCMVLLAQTEMRADRTQARKAGVVISLGDEDIKDLERARVELGMPKFSKEELALLKAELGTIHEVHGDSAESLFNVVLDAVNDNIYHVIVIDSFGTILSGAEAEEKDLNNVKYAGAAKPITQFLKKLSSMLTMDNEYGQTRDVCILGINQIRDAIGQQNVDYRSTGGRALEHAKFVDLYVESGTKLGDYQPAYTSKGMDKRWIQTGKEVRWRIEKGKAGIHEGARGSYLFDFGTGSGDFYTDTLVAGVYHKVIEQNGNWLGIPNPQAPGKYLLYENGKDKFLTALAADAQKCAQEGSTESLMNFIRVEAFKKNGIYINYDWE